MKPAAVQFLESIIDPGHREHEHLLDWHGGPFDPENIEEDIVKIQMGRFAAARCKRK